MDASMQVVEAIAQTIREHYNIPVIEDLDAIVQKMGGMVIYDSDKRIFDDCSIYKTGKGFTLTVPERQSKEQRNVSIVSGIGYLFLYMSYSNRELWNSLHDGMYPPSTREKKRIRMFASAFLMPAEQYTQVLKRYTIDNSVDISMVAKHFHVPVDIAVIRGRTLGLLNW